MGPFATFHRHPAPRRQESCRDVSWMNWSLWPWPPRRVPRSASSRTCGWSSSVASPLGLGDLSLGRFGRPCRRGLGKDVGKTSRIRVETSIFFWNLLFLQLYFLCWLRVWRYVMMNKLQLHHTRHANSIHLWEFSYAMILMMDDEQNLAPWLAEVSCKMLEASLLLVEHLAMWTWVKSDHR